MGQAQLTMLIDEVKREADYLALHAPYESKCDPSLIARMNYLLTRVIVTLEHVQASGAPMGEPSDPREAVLHYLSMLDRAQYIKRTAGDAGLDGPMRNLEEAEAALRRAIGAPPTPPP